MDGSLRMLTSAYTRQRLLTFFAPSGQKAILLKYSANVNRSSAQTTSLSPPFPRCLRTQSAGQHWLTNRVHVECVVRMQVVSFFYIVGLSRLICIF